MPEACAVTTIVRIFYPAALILPLLLAVPTAEAQIYSWRDAAGTLVISNRPAATGDAMTTYAVAGEGAIRTTTPAAERTAVSGRGRDRFDDLIDASAREHGVSPGLVRAVIQAESGFDPWAISPKGAMGLMQLMPATARDLGVRDPFHPGENIRGGVTYLARLLARYDQNVELALAAYNAGPANVERYGFKVPPFRETRDYVKKITARTDTASAAPRAPVIYKWTELIDGRATVRYTNVPPPTGTTFQTIQ